MMIDSRTGIDYKHRIREAELYDLLRISLIMVVSRRPMRCPSS